MICQYCNTKMISGFVQARGEIFFTEKPHKLLFGASGEDITLSHNNMTAPTCTAYCCPYCKKVIIDYGS